MSDKQAILDAARATLERTANLPNLGNLPPPESRADRWRREADETEAARLRERERLTAYEAAQPEARLAGMVAERSDLMEQLLPELLAAVFRRITAEVNEAVGQLRADVAVQRGVDRVPAGVVETRCDQSLHAEARACLPKVIAEPSGCLGFCIMAIVVVAENVHADR